MIKQPLERRVEFMRATYVDGKVVPIGEQRTFGTAFACELVSGGKAKFVVPVVVVVEKVADEPAPQPDPETKPEAATAAKKGK